MSSLSRLVLASLLPLAAVVPTGCAHPGTVVVHPGDDANAQGLVVTGTGTVTIQPDMAKANFGVSSRARTAGEATTAVHTTVARLIEATRSLGVAPEDIRTQHLSLYEERDEMSGPHFESEAAEAAAGGVTPLPTTHYVAQNMIEVTVRDLARLGEVLGAVTRAGANQMHGVEFGLADPSPAHVRARELAVADAKYQAEQMAKSAGVRLGRIVAVRTVDNYVSSPFGGSRHAKMVEEAAVSGGTLTVSESVSLRFELVAD